MQVAIGTVVNGKVVVEGVSLVEGAVVAVVARGADETFTLSPQDENELAAAIEEVERGEFISAHDLLEGLKKFG